VLRQVELEGPMHKPLAAAALRELPDASTDGVETVQEYQDRYGSVAAGAISLCDPDFPHEEIASLHDPRAGHSSTHQTTR
jgi:hypothetical protein